MSAVLSSPPPSMSASVRLTPSARVGLLPPSVRRGAWQLAARQVLSLAAERPRVLRVRQGRLWVTFTQAALGGSDDLVIGPGESLAVPAGRHLVMEPWDGHGATFSWD